MNEMKAPAGSVFEMSGVPPMKQVVPLGLQHVVAAIVGVITPAILVSNAVGLEVADKTLLIQVSLLITAIATLVQVFGLWRVGAKLPVVMGVSFAYVPTLLALANGYHDLGVILGAQIVGGCVAILFGIFVKQLRAFFPPMVTGTVIFTIGLSLYPTAVKYMAAARAPPTSVPGRTGWSPSSRWRSSSSATTSPRASPSWRPS